MKTSGCKSLFNAEPVQWAVDYLQGLLEILEQNSMHLSYGGTLLALEREELRQIWHRLLAAYSDARNPVFYVAGIEGARLFVIRQLLAALPPLKPCPLHKPVVIYRAAARRLAQEHDFLKDFRLPLDEKAPCRSVVEQTLKILADSGLQSRLLLAGRSLHLYCLDYCLPHPAYYLFPSHTIVCGATNQSKDEQIFCLLHEAGHVLYASATSRLPQPADPAARKKAAERFAARFADMMVSPVR
jgi:hypothetical protein